MKVIHAVLYLALIFIPSIASAELQVNQPWIAAAPPGSRVLAAYMVLQNTDDRDRTLVSVVSNEFAAVQIHRSVMKQGVMTMAHLSSVIVPEHGTLELSPGGFHMMLMNPVEHFRAGDTVELTLIFKDEAQMSIRVPVKKR